MRDFFNYYNFDFKWGIILGLIFWFTFQNFITGIVMGLILGFVIGSNNATSRR